MRKKILIIDDEADILRLVTMRLHKEGYDVVTLDGGSDAIPAVCREKPDLILLDIRLPGQDGFSICRQVKGNPQLKDIPIIIFTAVNPTLIGDDLRSCEADGWVFKPYHSEELVRKIRGCLRQVKEES